ncbi:holdfast attachment protein A [Asticcacaulis biprosthecium C19]|uniref:Holdfast attachment protein A n=2 Tax=Asticcacaulis biprosthecium TaxID=76891 RepID=F4QSA0_9CAUL|nr:holdfast anchoring protein HfaA [Asticcacaulis biprosthecium]ADF45679.1 holdfast anchor protein HfaA [Asticcacaulis biprosthecium]EGF89620.1 holdfast attachment protein A [Asticcacaulis biprosthecium C19]
MSLTKAAVLALAGIALVASPALAQNMSTKKAAFETGYGIGRNQMQHGVDPSTRDANGNRVLLDGSILTGSDQSVFSYSKTLGAGDTYAGAGGRGGATAIGNNLQVIVNGNHNTVIVHSNQVNNGNVTANNGSSSATAPTGTTTNDITGQVNF